MPRPDAQKRSLLERAFAAAVEAADPERIPADLLPPVPAGRLAVVGAGKAAGRMAKAVERHYRDVPSLEGLVIVPDGALEERDSLPRRIEVAAASHPIPDVRGVAATRRILDLVHGYGPDDQVVVVLSGGGSSLLVAPEGIDLAQKTELTRSLLRSGARIEEINTVRKHLSKVKGGRLALAASPARTTALVLSDVVGDDLSAVASGPSVADPTTFADALEVLVRYEIKAPGARRVLEQGIAGRLPETPKPGDPRLAGAATALIGNNQASLEAAAELLRDVGYEASILSSVVVGEAREVGRVHAAIARQVAERGEPFTPPCALLSGGETTVTVRAAGRGGRNSEFALGLALELPERSPIWALAADTDGRDGSEHNAGVLVTPELLTSLDRRAARASLEANDSYAVFADSGHLLVSGPTGTNVNDLRIILIDPSG
ncbi:MAG TPA: glycerate kinase [Trueperaceae bacterium]